MRKVLVNALMVAALMAGGTATASAQDILGGILSSVKKGTSGSGNSTSANDLLAGLTTIFSDSKVATKENIVGTWVYEEPAVVFESKSILTKAGGSLMSKAIEKKLQNTLNKYGITKGKMKMTFDKKGNFTQTMGKKKAKGTYTIDGKNVNLQYASGIKQLIGTTQLEGNSLLIVMDASKLLKFASTVSSLTNNSTLKAANSMLSNVDGMECGIRMKKQ